MTSEQTQRMREAEIDELINELNHDADEHKAFVPSDKSYQRMRHGSVRAISQLRSDLTAMTERAEKAEHDAAVKKNALAIMQDQAKKHHAEVERVRTIGLEYANDLTEAREQLAEAVEALEKIAEYEMTEWDIAMDDPDLSMCVSMKGIANTTLSRLSPSPKQTAGEVRDERQS